MNINFICNIIGNQEDRGVLQFYTGMSKYMTSKYRVNTTFTVWTDEELNLLPNFGVDYLSGHSFETYERDTPAVSSSDVENLIYEYREVYWSVIVASERSFTDYSMLNGSSGERQESNEYVQEILVKIVRFFERTMDKCDAIVCQTADTLLSLVAVKVAEHLGIRVYSIVPASLLANNNGGGFFANDEYLHCKKMVEAYNRRINFNFTDDEFDRLNNLIESIRGFSGITSYIASTSKGKSRGKSVLSPNIKSLAFYLYNNCKKNKKVNYNKINILKKLQANVLRVKRKLLNTNCYGKKSVSVIPKKSIFYALHYQPEQSTLAQGIWYANQVALIENISKSIPLGYTLVIKEHPWARGRRPKWQYKHMASFYNTIFCDAPSKDIIQSVDAVITVTGTVAVEALVFDKPVVILGQNYFDYCDLFYKAKCITDLPEILANILIDRSYDHEKNRLNRVNRFLISYLEGIVPAFPVNNYSELWGQNLALDLGLEAK